MTPQQTASHGSLISSPCKEHWSEFVRGVFGGLEVEYPRTGSFHAEAELHDLAEAHIARIRASAMQVWHSGSISAFSEQARFLVKTQVSGTSEITIGDSIIRLTPGDFVICDNARCFCLDCDENNEIISFPVTNALLKRYFPDPERFAFKKPDLSRAVPQLASQFVVGLSHASRKAASLEERARLCDAYLELLALSLRDAPNEVAGLSTVQEGHVWRCKTYIRENLCDEDLSPDDIAAANHLSKRYLQRLFASCGTSVMEFLLTARLQRAGQMLRSKQYVATTISEIAYQCGFKSLAHFTRSFKMKYKETPTAYRERSFMSVGRDLNAH